MSHRCPRRDENPQSDKTFPGPDKFAKRHGLISQSKGCSYCGSMDPVEFLQKLKDGWVLSPTDKNYKAYIGEPMSDQEIADRREIEIVRNKQRGFKQEEAEKYVDEVYGGVLTKGQEGKFYYQHLSEAQKHEFIDMLNAKTMKIGYPGYIYTKPYFIA